jgi:GH24 family phage-related lysozyme (muramidase)
MRQAVRDAWWDFSEPLEGYVPHMYADVKGLITTGVGNLIDPLVYALQLPWKRGDGSAATRDEIVADWAAVKNDPRMARDGHRRAALVTRLRLTKDDIKALVAAKVEQNWRHMRSRWGVIDEFPADGQLGLCSMAWAVGPAFRWPMFEAALKRKDFAVMATECTLQEKGNPGVRPRNVYNRRLFLNAAAVTVDGLDADRLYFPEALISRTAETPLPPPPLESGDLDEEDVPTRVIDITDIVHPDVPVRGFPEPPDEPPDAA